VNRQLRRLAAVLMALFVVLFAQLNVLQVARADRYRDDPRNTVELARDQARARGRILSADGQVLAESVPVEDRFAWQRRYPLGDLFAHPVGAFSPFFGADGIEQTYNDVLVGETSQQRLRNLGNLFSTKQRTGDVQTTLRVDLQQVAREALGEREGSVAVIDPRSGAVLALWSWPSYDPNTVAGHDIAAAEAARKALLADPAKPLLGNAYQERYMPGSTFKIVTTTAALMNGVPADRPWETERSYTPPDTKNPIFNYGRTLCGGDFFTVFTVSCNTPFARLGNELGAEKMVETTKAFGIGTPLPIDLPGAASSFFGEVSDFAQDQPRLAQSSFGQNAVSVVPLHLAIIAGAVANGGRMMVPFVGAATVDGDGTALQRHAPKVWKTPMTPEVAATMNEFMVGVAQRGTARCCLELASGAQAAAKTGTAQLRATDDPRGPLSHAWITAFAPAEAPRVAVAVMVKASPEVTTGVGGTVAGPVARAVLDRALEVVP
jgi:peptidoglycan glycosyltransferase